jgi:CTP synthase (UTP-ammonia lyase)
MARSISIGLVGDYDPTVTAHQAIPRAIDLSAAAIGREVRPQWIPTESITGIRSLESFDGLWCVPASPYRSTEGALTAIRYARETPKPFLGTCGGFQHAVLEYARNVLGWADADHAELTPDAERAVIAPLQCSLVEETGGVRFREGSRLALAYGVPESVEGYHCSYGLNPHFARELTGGPLEVTATDESGDIRALELQGHPFFVLTLFQPERAALRGVAPPVVTAFLQSML